MSILFCLCRLGIGAERCPFATYFRPVQLLLPPRYSKIVYLLSAYPRTRGPVQASVVGDRVRAGTRASVYVACSGQLCAAQDALVVWKCEISTYLALAQKPSQLLLWVTTPAGQLLSRRGAYRVRLTVGLVYLFRLVTRAS